MPVVFSARAVLLVPSWMTPAKVDVPLPLAVSCAAEAPLLVITPALEPERLVAVALKPLRSRVAVVAPVPTVTPPVALPR